jgi:hypothetical protein
MVNKIFLLLVVFSTTILIAQDSKILELSLGGNFLIPISGDWDGNYFVGVSTGLGFVLSSQTILRGSISYLIILSDEDSPETWESLPGIIVAIKRTFSTKDSTIIPYLQLEAGLFIPMADDQFYSVFPELCGSIGLEFLLSRNTFLFIDVGYMLGVAENLPKLISTNVGINFRI